MNLPKKKTKIVCTIGPASSNQDTLEDMILAGMNIARINLAHGDLDGHRRSVSNVRAAAKATGQRVTTFADLPGPKMRIGRLVQEEIVLERGQPLILQNQEVIGDNSRVSMDFERLPQVVKPDDSIFMNDGYIQLKVVRIAGDEVHCKVIVGGEIRSNNGVNLPGIDLGISAFTDRDRELIAFAAEEQIEGVGVSFVQGPEDIMAVRKAAASLGYEPFIISKIERAMALDNIDVILELTDGIMVARGDLGVEIPIAKIPSAQKELIKLANLASKPVITATQMLESMTHNRRPTRSEATDVANAILDGTDCVMLSGETAIGSYPVETVATMTSLAEEAECKVEILGIADSLKHKQVQGNISHSDLVSLAVYLSIKTLQPELVIILAKSGATARRVTRFGLRQWIAAPSLYEKTCQNLQFSRGIHPTLVTDESELATPEARRDYASKLLGRYNVDYGVVLVIEGSGTLQTQEIKRLDIINLG